MIELAFGELKQGLICCTVYRDCRGCPMYQGDDLGPVSAGDLTCSHMLMAAALNCINVMEKDLIEVNRKAENWEEIATKHEQEIIRLNESFDRK